jgi:hypothetical protein
VNAERDGDSASLLTPLLMAAVDISGNVTSRRGEVSAPAETLVLRPEREHVWGRGGRARARLGKGSLLCPSIRHIWVERFRCLPLH